MAAELALTAILVLVGAAALGGLVLRVDLARQIAAFEAIDGAVADFERDSWRSAAGGQGRAATGETDELRFLMNAADARYRAAGRAIAAAQDERAQ